MNKICVILVLLLSFFPVFPQNQNSLPKNYSEYPNPIIFNNGAEVTDVGDWEIRRNEILNLFSENVYGTFPASPDSMSFEVIETRNLNLGSPCIFKHIKISAYQNGNSASFRTLIYIPISKLPVPVFVLINHREVESFQAEDAFIDEYWPADKIIKSGFATAMLISRDVSPDNKDLFQNGIISSLFPQELAKPDGMKTISAWAWGASRVLDYLETDIKVDAHRAAVIGHSRSGKTALWCGANDLRFKLVISNNSGNSGAALARRSVGEQVSRINSYFPHWFCDNYNKYNEDVFSLPVDQHMLLSLIAPRALYVASASDDEWADPRGEFYSLNMSVPVYKLFYPSTDLLIPPANNNTISSQMIAYHIREGKHGLELSDWEKYMNFFRELKLIP